jgi:EPS-associated MarR family transcriptional regulator
MLQEDTYFRVLKILSDNPQINQRELSRRLSLSLGGVNYSLKALIEKGFVKVQNFNASKSKLGYAYLLTSKGVVEKTALAYRFLLRKMREYEEMRSEIEVLKLDLLASDLLKDEAKQAGIK